MAERTITSSTQIPASQSSGAANSAAEEEWFDLLPVEKKLIGYSLGLGVILLVVFIFAFGVFH
jgi:hypothetical protein